MKLIVSILTEYIVFTCSKIYFNFIGPFIFILSHSVKPSGTHLTSSYKMSSNTNSGFFFGGTNSLKTNIGKAKFMVDILIIWLGFFNMIFKNSIPTNPTTVAVVVARAGIIFPAIILISNLSNSFML